jgi:acyl carrier protein
MIEELRTLVADVLRVPPSQIDDSSTPQHFENWDSIQHVSLVVAIEEQFGVEFEPEEIRNMESIGKIDEILSWKLASRT